MIGTSGNIYQNIPAELPEELQQNLLKHEDIRIERIVSRSHRSPEDFMYDQHEDEFVLLLKGSAELCFEKGEKTVSMSPGDWMIIPAHTKHRVEATNPDENTVWLAVFMTNKASDNETSEYTLL